MTVASLAGRIVRALQAPNPVLFTGAGVSCRLGMPDWPSYLLSLATAAETHRDPDAAVFIRSRVSQGSFLDAATVFKQSRIPATEKYKALAAPFTKIYSPSVLEKITPLITLPFTAIVTTNFDDSPHQVFTQQRLNHERYERGQLHGVALSKRLFVARIHGQAERPESIALDSLDYRDLRVDDDYLDFLFDILRFRSCLFVGFSFLDPAISHVLDLYQERSGPAFNTLHTALIPDNSRALSDRLLELGIEPVTYVPDNNHVDLWRSIRSAYADINRAAEYGRPVRALPARPAASLHRFMAFAFSQLEASRGGSPITQIVQEGIVMSVLPATDAEVADRLRPILGLSAQEALTVTTSTLDRLLKGEAVRRVGDVIEKSTADAAVLDKKLVELADHALDRLRVRTQLRVTPADRSAAARVLELVFLSRAWDLAAHFAGTTAGWAGDLRPAIANALSTLPQPPSNPRELTEAIIDLLKNPEARQAQLLVDIGRAAFALQLVLSTPRSSLFRKYTLPETIYLDASILLPAITPGHPLQLGYTSLLRQLRTAAEDSGIAFSICVGEQFLNEVVSHRGLAEQEVREGDFDNPQRLERHALFYGLTDGNVFVAAFAAAPKRKGQKFREFLRDIAPYRDERELAQFLSRKGIAAVPMPPASTRFFADFFLALRDGYAPRLAEGEPPKKDVLVQHEAQQLAFLARDAEEGARSLFVTADRRLRVIIRGDDRLRVLGGSVVSEAGLLALVDVMVGLSADAQSLSRIVWATPRGDEQQSLLDFFIKLGLRRYEQGMAMEMQELARTVAREAEAEAHREHIDLLSDTETGVRARFLDRYADRFFESWRNAVDRHEEELRKDRESLRDTERSLPGKD